MIFFKEVNYHLVEYSSDMNLPIINEIKFKISYQLLMHTYMGAQRSKKQQKHVKRAIIYCTYYSLTLSSVTSLSFNLRERKRDHWSKLSFGRLFTICIAVGIASHESQNQQTVSVLCYQQFHYFEAWADPSLLCRIKSWKKKAQIAYLRWLASHKMPCHFICQCCFKSDFRIPSIYFTQTWCF